MSRPISTSICGISLRQIKCFPVGFLQVNPETVERNDGVVGEAAATLRGGDFALATNSIFRQRHDLSSEEGNLRHEHRKLPASTP